MTVRMCIFEISSSCRCVFPDASEFGISFLFCPRSRSSQSPAVLDLASKSTKREVSLGGCSLNEPPFLMLLKGSTRFNTAKTFSINQASVETLQWVLILSRDSQKRILPPGRCRDGWGGGRGVDHLVLWWSMPLGLMGQQQ